MDQNNDVPELSKDDNEKDPRLSKTTDDKRTFSLSQLKHTQPRSVDDIRKRIREGRFAELTPRQAGIDD